MRDVYSKLVVSRLGASALSIFCVVRGEQEVDSWLCYDTRLETWLTNYLGRYPK